MRKVRGHLICESLKKTSPASRMCGEKRGMSAGIGAWGQQQSLFSELDPWAHAHMCTCQNTHTQVYIQVCSQPNAHLCTCQNIHTAPHTSTCTHAHIPTTSHSSELTTHTQKSTRPCTHPGTQPHKPTCPDKPTGAHPQKASTQKTPNTNRGTHVHIHTHEHSTPHTNTHSRTHIRASVQVSTDVGLRAHTQAGCREHICIHTHSYPAVSKTIIGSLLLHISGAGGGGVKLWFRGKLKDSQSAFSKAVHRRHVSFEYFYL